ncbi:unnamed protein product [Dibothriocephalus latus]|uniref:Uncharacterized protein n=1 Tax=Dibothriocephalus latus TaxID=60516 RepID=A0A3P6TV87_DIBLA|nr:unnamed protein product [Dibothriocephalus latus]
MSERHEKNEEGVSVGHYDDDGNNVTGFIVVADSYYANDYDEDDGGFDPRDDGRVDVAVNGPAHNHSRDSADDDDQIMKGKSSKKFLQTTTTSSLIN